MHPKKNKAGRSSVYNDALKIAAARDYLTSPLSLSEVAKKYQLKNEDVVRWFVRWYNKHYDSELSVSNSPPGAPIINAEKEVKDLQRELANANLKIAALEIMIEIAEQDLGIEIRKKPGTKQ